MENRGAAEVVSDNKREALAAAVRKLVGDEEYRFTLARTALAKGREFFAHENVVRHFRRALGAGC
jgi:hypothetical protein